MSEWFEIDDPENVEMSKDGTTIEILFNTNELGNQYVDIPVEFIKRLFDGQPLRQPATSDTKVKPAHKQQTRGPLDGAKKGKT